MKWDQQTQLTEVFLLFSLDALPFLLQPINPTSPQINLTPPSLLHLRVQTQFSNIPNSLSSDKLIIDLHSNYSNFSKHSPEYLNFSIINNSLTGRMEEAINKDSI